MSDNSVTVEIWKAAPGFEDTYGVSSHGRVMRTVDGGGLAKAGRILKLSLDKKNGYLKVTLKQNRRVSVHRLVALAFLQPPEDVTKTDVNHIDGNKQNNHAENLEWATRSENAKHAVAHGLQPIQRGEQQAQAKLDEQMVREIRARYSRGGESLKSLAIEFAVDKALIQRIIKRRSWKHVE